MSAFTALKQGDRTVRGTAVPDATALTRHLSGDDAWAQLLFDPLTHGSRLDWMRPAFPLRRLNGRTHRQDRRPHHLTSRIKTFAKNYERR